MTDRIVVLGAGDHARVLVACLQARGTPITSCIARERPDSAWPVGIDWLGDDDILEILSPADVLLLNGIGSIGMTALRRSVYEAAKARGFRFASAIHPSAIVGDNVHLGEGVQIMAGAVVQTGTTLGDNTLINTGAIIDHDCRIGAHSHVATGAALSGGITLGDGVHVGTGSTIVQGLHIGTGSVIGAGAAVTRDIPESVIAAGVPARVVKPITPGRTPT